MSVLMNDPHPCYIRYYAGPRVVERTAPFELGKAAQLSDGRHVTLLTYGFLVREAADARRRLEARGITVRLVDVQMLKPFDEAAVLAAAADTQLLVTLEDHLAVGGLASLVAETLVRHQTRARTLTLALDDRWFRPALLPDVLAVEGFTGEAIARRIEEVLS
jgi:transketolase